MSESIRKQLIIKLLMEGDLTIKEISERADCTTGYVYNIRTEWMLENAQKAAPVMRELNKKMEEAVKPKPFSNDWQPNWWQLILLASVTWAALYFILVVAMSF